MCTMTQMNHPSDAKNEKNLGVIKNSITDTQFFAIYSSDFSRMCSNDERILYADDALLVYVKYKLLFIVTTSIWGH